MSEEYMKNDLWKLWLKLCGSDDIVSFELSKDGTIHLLDKSAQGPKFTSIQNAIDYLDPSPNPTNAQWRAAWLALTNAPFDSDESRAAARKLNELSAQSDRAKDARRD